MGASHCGRQFERGSTAEGGDHFARPISYPTHLARSETRHYTPRMRSVRSCRGLRGGLAAGTAGLAMASRFAPHTRVRRDFVNLPGGLKTALYTDRWRTTMTTSVTRGLVAGTAFLLATTLLATLVTAQSGKSKESAE